MMKRHEYNRAMQPRIMFIDDKSGGLAGAGRIGRVEFSQTGRTVYYRGRQFKAVKGYKYNYIDAETGAEFWISGCKRRGGDTLYGGIIHIDDDVREEYWTAIRNKPDCKDQKTVKCPGKHR
jgi:hypothetical protein